MQLSTFVGSCTFTFGGEIMTYQHSDWKKEEEKLGKTVNLIQKEIILIEKETGVGAREKKRITVPKDLAVSEQVAMDLLKRKITTMHQLTMAQEKAYFARLDFIEKGKGKKVYYIGRWGVMDSEKLDIVVVDWRSPAANLYYSGQIGPVSYKAPDGKVEGELTLKRLFSVEGRKLEKMSDTGLVGQEKYLEEILSKTTSNKLKDVVTTIQAEQNIVIRHSPFLPLMVQGVAGSGKTTIALHRIAWLLYAYQREMTPNQMMIIAPNPLFLDYISQVLPDLGVEEVYQTTFENLCKSWLKEKMPKVKKQEGIEERILLGEKSYQEKEKIIAQKGSLDFLDQLKSFLTEWEKTLLPKENLYFGKQLLFSTGEMKEIFDVQLKYFTWTQKIKEFQKMYKRKLEEVAKKLNHWLYKQTEEKMKKIMLISCDEERQEKVQKLLKSREQRVKEVKMEKEKQLKAFKTLWPTFNLIEIYQRFMTSLLEKEAYGKTAKETLKTLTKTHCTVEDLPPIVEIGRRIIPFPKKDIRHSVIDEAQDFSPFMIHLLKEYVKNDSFTLVGDILQGIHGRRGISSWETLNQENFKNEGELCYLGTSYRSTIEIMEVAIKVLKNSQLLKNNQIHSVLRHGEKPQILTVNSKEEARVNIVETIKTWQKKGYQNIALVVQTYKEGKEWFKQLKGYREVTFLDEDLTKYLGGCCIVSLAIAKGLEFDGVIIPNGGKDFYPKEAFYGKLLYVACTRALHELKIFYQGEKSLLLE